MESALPVSAPFTSKILDRRIIALLLTALVIGCGEPDAVIETSDGSTMILIPAGVFPRGGTAEEVSEVPDRALLTYYAERPISDITMSAYYIDKFEVTNAQYRKFLDAVAGKGGRWDHADQPDNTDHGPRHVSQEQKADDHPAAGLNWFDAYAYCAWADKRLPSEAEWEYAARGSSYRIFPWGDHEPHHDGIFFANFRPEHNADADGFRETAPVGSFPDGVSAFGIQDMSGNAEEWVQDWYDYRYFGNSRNATDPTGPAEGVHRVIKGGSFGTTSYQVRIAQRFKGKPHNKGPRIGFRCARDV